MIRWGSDLAAPVLVTVIDLAAETTMGNNSQWITYAMTAIGYLGAIANKGGDFVKNIGVSSLPLTGKRIYDAVRSPSTPVTKMAAVRGRVSRYPGTADAAPFAGVKLT